MVNYPQELDLIFPQSQMVSHKIPNYTKPIEPKSKSLMGIYRVARSDVGTVTIVEATCVSEHQLALHHTLREVSCMKYYLTHDYQLQRLLLVVINYCREAGDERSVLGGGGVCMCRWVIMAKWSDVYGWMRDLDSE